MTIATKIIFIAALILSIIIPFGYYLIGEKNKKRYKRTIGINAFFFFGAFAIASIAMLAGPDSVHAAIMEVVLQLAGAESGHPNWIGVIFGNLFVCGFEGLIVGIQVLRLEYYEMFSRFYSGSGRAFNPYTKKKKNKQA